MLSYAKHGKFPALTQAAQAKSRRKSALPAQRNRGRPCSALAVDHGMERTANAPRPFLRGGGRTGAAPIL